MTVDRFLADVNLLDALAQAVIVTDRDGTVLAWNDAAGRLYGYQREQILGRNVVELLVNPEDTAGAGGIMSEVLAGRAWQGEFSVRRADGSTFLARVTDTPLRDASGEIIGVVGVSEDVSEAKLVATQAADRERRLRLALSAGRLGTWQYDEATGIVTWDQRLEAIYGLEPGGFPGTYDAYLGLLYPEERDEVTATVRKALADGGHFQVRHRVLWPDGTVRWVEGQGQAVLTADGTVTGAIGCSRDITEHVVAAERTERLRRLTEDLATTYTVEEVGAVVRERAQGDLGALLGALLLPDPSGRMLIRTAGFGYPAGPPTHPPAIALTGGNPAADTFRDGHPRYFHGAAELKDAFPGLAGTIDLTRVQGLACLPLVAAETTVGVLALGFAAARRFDDEDRAALVALAGQCAQAVERARLVSRLRHISGALQHGLAPDAVPRVPGLDLAALYRPGGDELEEVGGDWYDVVAHDDGRVSLMVGDVMGRGVEAAAAMIRLRGALRAYATDDPEPARVLDRLDRLADPQDESFVTVFCALVDPAAGQVQVASAGHLPALLAGTDGGVTDVELAPSPPVGLAAEPRPVATVRLPPGGVLLAFTDGLVERSDRSIDDGMAQLAAAAGTLAPDRPPLAGLLTELVEVMDAGDSGDDVTVLAVRRG